MSKRRSGSGRITRGIVPGTLAMKTLAFVQQQLPKWRDNPNRPEVEAEEDLNSQLCKYLNITAPREFPMVHFSHEERQPGRRRVDLAANPVTPTVIAGQTYSEFDPFLVIEGKRLPAPSKDREREYVTGMKSDLVAFSDSNWDCTDHRCQMLRSLAMSRNIVVPNGLAG